MACSRVPHAGRILSHEALTRRGTARSRAFRPCSGLGQREPVAANGRDQVGFSHWLSKHEGTENCFWRIVVQVEYQMLHSSELDLAEFDKVGDKDGTDGIKRTFWCRRWAIMSGDRT
jgi:hypothetical protein